MTQKHMTIAWLYPDLMSIYGDRGNIVTINKRCSERGIKTTILPITLTSNPIDILSSDIIFAGGAQDSQQSIVSVDLKKNKGLALREAIERGTPGLYICGAYQFLGHYYKEATGNILPGLGIFDLYTENPGENHKRLIGNVSIDASHLFPKSPIKTLVGFENHGGRTYLGKSVKPLGKVISGFGNNGKDHTEGAIFHNSFGSYFHGPILPKNPHLADLLIKKALELKYKEPITLLPLDDSLAYQAHREIIKKIQ